MKARAPKLGFIEPCFPRLVLKPPTGPEWPHELKYDGWRVQALKSKRGVRLFTRRGNDWTDRFGPIGEAIAQLPTTTAIVDGELVAEDETGRPDFKCRWAARGAASRPSLHLPPFAAHGAVRRSAPLRAAIR
jgi:bifunctional non-homologous end joining protein LigD